MTTTIFESKGEYTVKAKVVRTDQRKFKVSVVGEDPTQERRARAIRIAVEAALTLNQDPEPTMADVEAAESLTAKLGKGGKPGEKTEIRSGVSAAGIKVKLFRGGFGRFLIQEGIGRKALKTPVVGRDLALEVYALALTRK